MTNLFKSVMRGKASKYGNIRTMYDGFEYDSKHEAIFARDLDLRIKGKDIKSYEKQVSFPVVVNGKKICVYKADFVITHNNGTTEVVDCKGKLTDVYKLKKKLVEATYDIIITEIYRERNGKYK